MLNTDANTLHGLAQLSPAVKQFLTDELLTVMDRLLVAPEPMTVYRLQGKGEFLKELLAAIEHAEHPVRQPVRQMAR